MDDAVTTNLFQWPIRVYIEDTDAGGIVYYVNYLKYIERARTEYLRSLGFGRDTIFNADVMFVVHSLNTEYLKPARLDDQLIATAEVIETGRAFLVMAQKVYRSVIQGQQVAENELLSRSEVKIACVDRQTIKPRRIPAALIAAVSQ